MGHNEGMTTPETVTPPAASAAEAAPVAPEQRGRALAGAIAVFLGGYLVLMGLHSQLPAGLAGFGGLPPEYTLLLALQLAFGVLVVIGGYFLVPAPAARKLIASGVLVVGVVLTLVMIGARLSGAVNGGVALSVSLANAYFMVTLVAGAGWLIVRSARVGWLALLSTVVLIPLPFAFSMAGIGAGISQIVLLLATLIVGVVIIAAGRPTRG